MEFWGTNYPHSPEIRRTSRECCHNTSGHLCKYARRDPRSGVTAQSISVDLASLPLFVERWEIGQLNSCMAERPADVSITFCLFRPFFDPSLLLHSLSFSTFWRVLYFSALMRYFSHSSAHSPRSTRQVYNITRRTGP